MRRNLFRSFFGIAIVLGVGLPPAASFAQTMQQLRTCQGKTTDDPDVIISACSVFIETRRAVGGKSIPKMALCGILELRGNAYAKKRDLDRAIADYSEAIQINVKNYQYEFYYNRGNMYFQKSDLDRAIADYGESISIKPSASAYINRGNAYASKADYGQALVNYTYALRLEPKNALATQQMGAAKIAMKIDDSWLRYLQKIQDEGDYANWPGPPVQAFQGAK